MWPFRRKQLRGTQAAALDLPPQHPDDPQAFGFKNTWWALPAADTDAVVAAIRLQNAQPANWQTGLKHAYEGHVFVTPPIEGWTLITGIRLPPGGKDARAEVLPALLELSRTFGAALVFATHRVVDYHLWAKATSGTLIRGYGYVGESGTTFWDDGALTPEEQKLGFAFFDERCSDAEHDSYWEREDLSYPRETNVMAIARIWSISPSDLSNYKPAQRVLGFLGSHSELLKARADG